jgi:putative endonuclease
MKIFTYLLKSEIKEWYYTGISDNPERRLKEHNIGKVNATEKNRPYSIVYIKEHSDYNEARKQEKYLKKKNLKYKKEISDKWKSVRPAFSEGRGKNPTVYPDQ